MPSLNIHKNVEWIERETIRRTLEMSSAQGEAAKLMGSGLVGGEPIPLGPHFEKEVKELVERLTEAAR